MSRSVLFLQALGRRLGRQRELAIGRGRRRFLLRFGCLLQSAEPSRSVGFASRSPLYTAPGWKGGAPQPCLDRRNSERAPDRWFQGTCGPARCGSESWERRRRSPWPALPPPAAPGAPESHGLAGRLRPELANFPRHGRGAISRWRPAKADLDHPA